MYTSLSLHAEPATRQDLPEILALQKACYLSEALLYNDMHIPPLTQTLASVQQEYDQGWLFVKYMHLGKIIAAGRAHKEGDTAYIGKLTVHADYQNRKIGQQLLLQLEQATLPCKRWELFTGHLSHRNLYLYQKMGYQETKRIPIHEGLSMVYLEKWHSPQGPGTG